MPKRPLTIGWKEYLDFPDWGLRHVKVKIDTGARTSALGAIGYELHQVPGEGTVAELCLAMYRRHPERVKVVRARVLETIVVSNSSGISEQRPLIEVKIRMGPLVKVVRLTVANRASMLFPVILGRKALEGDFIVDVSGKYMLKKRTG
jgi:hypothetical protein